jgi:ATP-binding cassette, subfamily B (MDR/TAP), member 1
LFEGGSQTRANNLIVASFCLGGIETIKSDGEIDSVLDSPDDDDARMRRNNLVVDVQSPVYDIKPQSIRSSTYDDDDDDDYDDDLKKSTISSTITPSPPPPPPGPTPSIRLLFSLISRRHVLLLLFPAMASSIIAGGVAPFMTFVVGQAFDSFAQFPTSPNPPQHFKDALLRGVGLASLELVALGVGALMMSSITSWLWIWLGERNVMALRKKVYKAITEKDMVWFDLKMGAEGNVQSDSGDDGPLGAGGLMAKFARSVISFPINANNC